MVKKYLLDIMSIILVSAIAVFATQKPAMDLTLRPSNPSKGDKSKLPDVKKEKKEEVQKEILKEVIVLGALKERNIFRPDGGYAKLGEGLKGPLPENPYTLIGILYGEEKKAVFRDYKRSIIVLTMGEKLVDGSIITNIDRLSVQLEKGNEKKELKVFDLTDPKRRAPSKAEISPRPGRMAPQEPGEEIRPRPERKSRERPERAPRQQPRK
jgi:hypothetical protein